MLAKTKEILVATVLFYKRHDEAKCRNSKQTLICNPY